LTSKALSVKGRHRIAAEIAKTVRAGEEVLREWDRILKHPAAPEASLMIVRRIVDRTSKATA